MRNVIGGLVGLGLLIAAGAGAATAASFTMEGSGFGIQLIDGSTNGVPLQISGTNFTYSSLPTFGSLSYSFGNGWLGVNAGTINGQAGDVLNLRLTMNNGESYLYANNSSHASIDYYSNREYGNWTFVTISFLEPQFSLNVVSTAQDGDRLAPVPVPTSILLLGSGLAGVVVIGRRRLMSH